MKASSILIRTSLLVTGLLFVPACEDDGDSPLMPGEEETGDMTTTGIDPDTTGDDPDTTGEEMTGSESGGVDGRPAEVEALLETLVAGEYSDWSAEAALHDTYGNSPHGADLGGTTAQVRSFFNDTLVESFTGFSADAGHDVGSVAVKEIVVDGELAEWAIMAKIAAGTENESWYWGRYKIDGSVSMNGDGIALEGPGFPACVGCHQGMNPTTNVDFVVTPIMGIVPETPRPMDVQALLDSLQYGGYSEWDAESDIHIPLGGDHINNFGSPHAGGSANPEAGVRTFFNPTLVASFEADAEAENHTMGSMAVKEMYNGDEQIGWVIMAKIAAEDSANPGDSWYWGAYTTNGLITNEAVGNPGCTTCHMNASTDPEADPLPPVDFVRTPFPLQ